jgi:hypothetical protein
MSSDLDPVTGIPAAGRQFRPGPALPPWRGGPPGTFLAGTGADQHCQQAAELPVSELVTNAVTHAPTTARLPVPVTGQHRPDRGHR